MKRVLFGLVLALSVAYLIHVARTIEHPPRVRWTASAIGAMVAGVCLYQFSLGCAALAWSSLLASVGEQPRVRRVAAILFLAQPAKYIPGNIAHYAGRTILATREGFAAPRVMVTIVVETVCALIAGAMFAFPGFHVLLRIAMVLIATIVLVLVARRFLDRSLPLPHPRAWLLSIASNCASFLLLGVTGVLLARFVFGVSMPYLVLTGTIAAAWVAGFVTPGAPGGLGVREAVFAAQLGGIYGSEIAVALPLVFRIATVAGDGVAFVVGTVLNRNG